MQKVNIKNIILLSCVLFIVSCINLAPKTVKASTTTIENQSSNSFSAPTSVAFGNGVFIVVGDSGSIVKSTDGMNWSKVSIGGKTFSKVIFGNNIFLATDGTGNVHTSSDGNTWTAKSTGSTIPGSANFSGLNIKFLNGKFFFMAYTSVYNASASIPNYTCDLFQSSDGSTWSRVNVNSFNNTYGGYIDIEYAGGNYVVATSQGYFYYSSNLTVWTSKTINDLYNWSWQTLVNIINENGKLLTQTAGNGLLVSTNGGATWSKKTDRNISYRGETYVNGNYVLLGDQSDGRLYTSSNGSSWATKNTNTGMTVYSIAYGNGNYVACGDGGLMVSSDFTKWNNISGSLKSIAYDGNGGYVAVANGYNNYTGGTYGSIYKTSDWTNWNDVTPNLISGGINSITYGGKFIAVTDQTVDSDYNYGNGLILTSNDGTTWTTQVSSIAANLTGIANNGTGTYALVTSDGRTFTSTNGGTSWTQRYSKSGYVFNSISYLNNQFIAVGTKYASGNPAAVVIAKSSDGTNWGTPTEIGSSSNCNMTGIAYSGSKYVIVGVNTSTNKGVIFNSTTLTTWQNISVNTSPLNSVSFGNGTFMAIGNGGTLMSSADGDTWSAENSNITYNCNGITYASNSFSVVGEGFSKMQVKKGNEAPGKPIELRITPGTGSVILDWTVASGATGYKVYQGITTNVYGASPVATVATNTATISGLTNGTTYYFVVKATNGTEDSENSEEVSGKPCAVPEKPTNVTATPLNGKAKISFTEPFNNGGSEITSYTVEVYSGDTLVKTVTGILKTSTTITELINGTSYTFKVIAINVIGASAPSDPSTAVTPVTFPSVPRNITAISGDGQITINFDVPLSDGGLPIKGYTVTVNPGGIIESDVASPVVVKGLTNGTKYTITIKAVNEFGGSSVVTLRNVTPNAP